MIRIEDKTIRVSCPFLCTDRYIIDLLKKNEKALIRMAKRSERQESRKEKILYLDYITFYEIYNKKVFFSRLFQLVNKKSIIFLNVYKGL